jgi:kynureninase
MIAPITRADCIALDRQPNPLELASSGFAPGAPDTIYLDANSIGPMPLAAPACVAALLEVGWRLDRRRGWSTADWLEQPRSLGRSVAHVIGAGQEDVLVCDSTSVNLYKLLRHALAVAAPRRKLVVERAVFPTNSHVAQGIARAGGAELVFIESEADLGAVLAAGEVAVVALSHVDYRSGTRLDMAHLTRLIHDHGALALWDLSHSAGAVAVRLRDCDADYAVAAGYKYLCGGPGAPALLYVHPRLQSAAWPAICGWMGHADTFGFDADYLPAPGVARQLAGTPAVIANAAWSAAAALWRQVDPLDMDARHRSLSDLLVRLLEQECAGLGIEVGSPREHACRGGHVAVRLTVADADVDALGQTLVADKVVVSTRKPDSLRFGIHPLVTRHEELWQAVQRLRRILETGRWRDPGFSSRGI